VERRREPDDPRWETDDGCCWRFLASKLITSLFIFLEWPSHPILSVIGEWLTHSRPSYLGYFLVVDLGTWHLPGHLKGFAKVLVG